MFSVTPLGVNSALPAYDRHPTSQVIKINDQSILMDCGEGTQMQMMRYHVKRGNINHIFISHLHGDHYLGLPGLLNTLSLTGRTNDLSIYAPSPLEEILTSHFKAAGTILNYPLHFHSLPMAEGFLMENDTFEVSTFLTEHRIECHGFVFKEKKNPRSINPEKIKAFDIPYSFYDNLQAGEDYTSPNGDIVNNNWVTDINEAPKSYGYCADSRYVETFLPFIQDVDLLYHETTYLEALKDKAYERYHSTSQQAATIALKANAKNLLIGHFSSQYEYLDKFLEEAHEIFPNTSIAVEGKSFDL